MHDIVINARLSFQYTLLEVMKIEINVYKHKFINVPVSMKMRANIIFTGSGFNIHISIYSVPSFQSKHPVLVQRSTMHRYPNVVYPYKICL